MELKKGETIMIDAALHLPAAFLHETFSDRSRVPPEQFELYRTCIVIYLLYYPYFIKRPLV